MKITFKKSLKLFFTMILCLVFFLVAGCSFNHTPVDVKEYTVTFKDEATGEVITTITRKTTSIIQERDILLGNYEIPEGYQYSWYVKVKDEKGNIVDKPVNFKDINTDTVVYIFLTAKEYTLKLYIDNVLVKQTAYNFAEEIKDFTDISREGYYFDGWYLNANYTDKQEMPKVMPAHNVELYGRWVADKVYKEVKFMNGNVQVAIKSVAVNEKITEPTAPTKVGYTFVGWYKEAELIEKFDFENEVMGDKNLTLYAKWEINSYTILLVSNLEGLNLSNKVREYNARIGNLFSSSEENELLSYPGYTFVGWYVDEELTKPFEKISMPAEDITLYAKWHFDGIKLVINGEIFKTISGKPGDAVDASLITVPNIEGYTFRGWFLSENPLPSDSKYEFNVLPKEQVVVYGVYDLVEYTITYYTDNGELSLEKDTYTILDDTYQIPKPNKKGYSFEGWFTDQTFTNEIFSIKKGTTGNIELYAKYEIITYSITIHANGGMIESIPTEYTVESDDIVLPTTGAKVGYSFQGFYSNASFDGLPITVISKGSIGDLELYVKWLADGSVPYIVEYYFEKLNNDEPLKENGKFNNEAFLETPIKKIFSAETGMEVQAEIISYPGFTSCHTASVKGVVSGDGSTVLKVYYSRNQYTYTFMSDDNILKQITVDYEDEITAPTNPTKEGYTFIGWDKEIPTTMPAEDLTITALWQVNEYTITFDTDGGTLIDDIVLKYGEAVTAPTNPTKVGYTFIGWDKEIPTTMPAEDLTITALWQVNEYTITFNTDGGTQSDATLEYTVEDEILLGIPTKEGYTFLGWYENDTKVEKISKGTTGDKLYTAKWELNIKTVEEVLALADDASAKVVAKVVAVYAKGYMVADNTGKILVFFSSFTQDFNIGDVVVVEGTKSTHNKGVEITSPTVTASTETIDLTEETPKELTAADLDAYASSTTVTVELVKLTGKLTISNNKYYNVTIDGTSKQGRIAYPLTGLVDSNLNGKNVVVTGYVFSINGTNYINIMALSVAEVELTDAEKVAEALAKVSAPATATEDFTLVEVEGVVWSLKAESVAATLAGNTVKVTRQSADTEIVLVATATFGEVTDSKEFTVTVLAEGTAVTEKTLTIDFSTATGKGSTVSSNALSFIEGYASEKIIKSATATKVYNGNSSGGKYGASAGLIRLGTSGANGSLTLSFNEGIKVSKVILNCYSWTASTNDKVTVGTSTVALPNGDAAEDLEFTLEGVNEFTITSVKRMFLFSITVIYSDGSSETPGLTDAEKVAEALAKVSAPATATEDFTLVEVGGVVWSLKAESVAATLAGNTVKVTRQSADTEIVLVATATFGEVTDSKEFTVTVLAEGTVVTEKTLTIDFSTATGTGTKVSDPTTFVNTYASVNILKSATATNVYDGNVQGGKWANSKGFVKMGANKKNGVLTLTFNEGVKVSKVVLNCYAWKEKGSDKVTVGTSTVALPNGDAAEDLEFTLGGVNEFTITSAYRMFLFSIVVIYSE